MKVPLRVLMISESSGVHNAVLDSDVSFSRSPSRPTRRRAR